MKSFYTLLVLSVVGIIVALGVIFYDQRPKKSQTEPIPQLTPPYKNFIAGTGIVESASKNIPVGAMVSGIIAKVNVQSGDKVTKGELLFSLDDKILRAKEATLNAAVKLAQTKLTKASHQLKILENFKKVSPEMVTNKNFAATKDNVTEAKAELQLTKAKRKALQKELALYKVYAPLDGIVLESKLSVGKYFSANSKLLTLGSNAHNLRVNINEYDTWKFLPDTNAVAFVRGHPKLTVNLTYRYTMPYVVPKKNLTGLATERTDTRVLQVLYSLPKKVNFPLYVGQQLDVFIQSKD
jgi:RND family efflux transporter MFP subunit